MCARAQDLFDAGALCSCSSQKCVPAAGPSSMHGPLSAGQVGRNPSACSSCSSRSRRCCCCTRTWCCSFLLYWFHDIFSCAHLAPVKGKRERALCNILGLHLWTGLMTKMTVTRNRPSAVWSEGCLVHKHSSRQSWQPVRPKETLLRAS